MNMQLHDIDKVTRIYEEAKGHTPDFVGTIVKILRNCNSSQKIFESKIL